MLRHSIVVAIVGVLGCAPSRVPAPPDTWTALVKIAPSRDRREPWMPGAAGIPDLQPSGGSLDGARWRDGWPTAALELEQWARDDPRGAREVIAWARGEPERFEVLTQWLVTRPYEPMAAFALEHPWWGEKAWFDDAGNDALARFVTWARRCPSAAGELAKAAAPFDWMAQR